MFTEVRTYYNDVWKKRSFDFASHSCSKDADFAQTPAYWPDVTTETSKKVKQRPIDDFGKLRFSFFSQPDATLLYQNAVLSTIYTLLPFNYAPCIIKLKLSHFMVEHGKR